MLPTEIARYVFLFTMSFTSAILDDPIIGRALKVFTFTLLEKQVETKNGLWLEPTLNSGYTEN